MLLTIIFLFGPSRTYEDYRRDINYFKSKKYRVVTMINPREADLDPLGVHQECTHETRIMFIDPMLHIGERKLGSTEFLLERETEVREIVEQVEAAALAAA